MAGRGTEVAIALTSILAYVRCPSGSAVDWCCLAEAARFLHVRPTLDQNVTEVLWRADYCRLPPAVISDWKLDCGVIVPVTRTCLAFDEAGTSYSRISTCYGVFAKQLHIKPMPIDACGLNGSFPPDVAVKVQRECNMPVLNCNPARIS